MVMVGMAWLLREVELSSLFTDQWTIGLNDFEKSALLLPSPKVDQQGTGVKRSANCHYQRIIHKGRYLGFTVSYCSLCESHIAAAATLPHNKGPGASPNMTALKQMEAAGS